MRSDSLDRWLIESCDPHPRPKQPGAELATSMLPSLFANALKHATLGACLNSITKWDEVDFVVQDDDPLSRSKIIADYRLEHFKNIGFTLGLREVERRALQILAAKRIPCTVLKGSDFADRIYPAPSLRPFRDVDLMVHREAFVEADRALQEIGLQPHMPRRKYDAMDYGQISYFSEGEEQWSVELHWNIINSPSQRQQCSLVWNDLQFLNQLGEFGNHLMTANSLLLVAAVHACIGHRFDSLQQLCDIRQICRGRAGTIDAANLNEDCRRLRCSTSVRWALEMLVDIFDCPHSNRLLNQTHLNTHASARFGLLNRRTVLHPQTTSSRLCRSVARWRLASAA